MNTATRAAALAMMLLALPAVALAQNGDGPDEPVTASLKGLHDITKNNLMKTAEMLDDAMYAYQPTEEVRTAGQILAHVANAQYAFCAAAAGEDSPNATNYEEAATTKADIVAALEAAFAYCDGVYAEMTDAEGAEVRNVFGMEMAASAILAFNAAHNYEHYGNLVTYMRINGMTPPSSM
ncbi:MAG: DinB family protein [Rhodothermales bacterium]|nr:DinB family protein [Rhodothermales bacterium]